MQCYNIQHFTYIATYRLKQLSCGFSETQKMFRTWIKNKVARRCITFVGDPPSTHVCWSPKPRSSFNSTASKNVRDLALTYELSFCTFLKGIKIALVVQKLRRFLLHLCKDYSALQHFRNHKLTSESPQISTRWPQTPVKGIWPLCCKCYTPEGFDHNFF